jgi:hypothetical protein
MGLSRKVTLRKAASIESETLGLRLGAPRSAGFHAGPLSTAEAQSFKDGIVSQSNAKEGGVD